MMTVTVIDIINQKMTPFNISTFCCEHVRTESKTVLPLTCKRHLLLLQYRKDHTQIQPRLK